MGCMPQRKCEVPECGEPHVAKGLCKKHYYAQRRRDAREQYRGYGRKHDAANKEKRRLKNKKWHDANRDYVRMRNRELLVKRNALMDAAKSKPCADCGQRLPPYCMDFHHLDPGTKRADVRRLAKHKLDVLLAEIDKCIVLCAVCHRRRHHER